MLLLMFVGAIVFCVFMILCFDNILGLKQPDIRKVLVLLAVSALSPLAVQLNPFGIIADSGYVDGIIYSIVQWLNNPNPFGFIVEVGYVVGIIYGIATKRVKIAIIVPVCLFALMNAVNSVATLSLRMLDKPDLFYAGFGWGVVNIIHFSALVVISFAVKKLLIKRVDMNNFDRYTAYLLFAISFVAAFMIHLINVEVLNPGFEIFAYTSDIAVVFLSLCIGVMVFIILKYSFRENAVRAEMLINEASKRYVLDLEDAYKALRTIKHDYINILTSFKLHIDSKDIDGLERYYYNELSQLNKDFLYQDKLLASLHNMGISEVKSVLIYKCSVAAEHQIDVKIEAREHIESLGVSSAIICQILGILLDNATEAAMEAEGKEIGIAIIKNPKSKTFIIKNTWNKKELSINSLYEQGFSTKDKKRGMGLYTVRNYADKIENLLLETEMGDEYFTQILTVKDVR